MTPSRLLGFVLLVLLASLAQGADEPAASVPDPVVLPSDWWTYFEAKEPIDDETLQKRVETAKKFYSELRQRLLSEGDTVRHEIAPGRGVWIQVVRGRVRLDDAELGEGDGAAVEEQAALELMGMIDAELLLLDLA